MMTYPRLSAFVAVLTAVWLPTGLSFIPPSPAHHHVSSSLTTYTARSTMSYYNLRSPMSGAPATSISPRDFAVKRSARRFSSSSSLSRLYVSEEGLGGEENSGEEEQSSAADGALLDAVGKVESPKEVDLTKGIAFEAPKPKAPAEVEEESQSKKVRVVLYTVLSLLPFLLLLPFLGGRELLPLDPSQM